MHPSGETLGILVVKLVSPFFQPQLTIGPTKPKIQVIRIAIHSDFSLQALLCEMCVCLEPGESLTLIRLAPHRRVSERSRQE